MKTELLRRLFRAIKGQPSSDLHRLAQLILDEERKKGHTKVANELSAILARASQKTAENLESRTISRLPVSRRSGLPLASIHPYEELRHDMVLPEHLEHRFHRIETEFSARERLTLYGLRPRKKVLLYGPPGCGKTLGAERLAWKLGLPLMKVRFDILMSSYLGESASNLREVFEFSRQAPRLLLLDECDSIAKARDSANDVGEMSRVVNTLLGLLEEYHSPGLLVATTNLSKTLDPALFRRFDDVIEIPLPGLGEISRLLKTTLSAINISQSVEWEHIVSRLVGCSAAQVVQVAQEAAKSCVLFGDKVLTQHHLDSASKEWGKTKG